MNAGIQAMVWRGLLRGHQPAAQAGWPAWTRFNL